MIFYALSQALPASGRRRVASEPRRHPDRLRLLPQRPARLEGHAPSPPLRLVVVVMRPGAYTVANSAASAPLTSSLLQHGSTLL